MTDFKQARKSMVDSQIATAGVSGRAILDAFLKTPREIFVPKALQGICYSDQDIEISKGRFLLSPMVHAKLLQAAQPKLGDVVLDISCAGGYSSAILSSLVTTVMALDSDGSLLSKAEKKWKEVDANNVVSVLGDLITGAKKHAPFDLIILNGAVSEIPVKLVEQLSDSGRLVTILQETSRKMGCAVLVQKNSGEGFSVKRLFDAHAPFLAELSPLNTFVF